MDSTTLSPEKIELSTVRKDEENDEVGSWMMHGQSFVSMSKSVCFDIPMSCVKLSMSKVCFS